MVLSAVTHMHCCTHLCTIYRFFLQILHPIYISLSQWELRIHILFLILFCVWRDLVYVCPFDKLVVSFVWHNAYGYILPVNIKVLGSFIVVGGKLIAAKVCCKSGSLHCKFNIFRHLFDIHRHYGKFLTVAGSIYHHKTGVMGSNIYCLVNKFCKC